MWIKIIFEELFYLSAYGLVSPQIYNSIIEISDLFNLLRFETIPDGICPMIEGEEALKHAAEILKIPANYNPNKKLPTLTTYSVHNAHKEACYQLKK